MCRPAVAHFLPNRIANFWTLSDSCMASGMTSFRPYQLSSVNHFPAGSHSRPPLSLTWCRQSIRSFHPPAHTPIAVFCSPLVAYCPTWTHPDGLFFPLARLHAIMSRLLDSLQVVAVAQFVFPPPPVSPLQLLRASFTPSCLCHSDAFCSAALLFGTPGYRGLCHRVVCFESLAKNKTSR